MPVEPGDDMDNEPDEPEEEDPDEIGTGDLTVDNDGQHFTLEFVFGYLEEDIDDGDLWSPRGWYLADLPWATRRLLVRVAKAHAMILARVHIWFLPIAFPWEAPPPEERLMEAEVFISVHPIPSEWGDGTLECVLELFFTAPNPQWHIAEGVLVRAIADAEGLIGLSQLRPIMGDP